MKKHVFTNPERYAVWKYHEEKCYLCEEPLRLADATCDHVIPEHLLDQPGELASVLRQFGLNESFKINDFNNWLPAHVKCNQRKGGALFRATPLMQLRLERLIRDAEKVRRIEQRLTENADKDLLLTQIIDALQSGRITQDEIEQLFPKGRPGADEDAATLYDEVSLHVDPARWKIVEQSGDVATVTDGRLGGITPFGRNPHHSWSCPYCWRHGPWNGNRCMSCGMMSDPSD